MNDNNQMTSSKEVDKLRIAWQEADALSRAYQGLARDAMAKYMAAIDGPTHRQPPVNLQADIAPATVEDVFNYLADRETDNV